MKAPIRRQFAAMGSDRLSRLGSGARRRLRRRLGITRLEERLDALERAYGTDINRAWALLDGHEERLGRAERQIRTATVMAWIEQAAVSGEPLVSVIIPSRDRAALLPRAIESVLAQTWGRWELLVCDDGSRDATANVVESFGDPRIRHLPDGPLGSSAARNRGLAVADGKLIAYLDDDNRMHPNWLKSVAWAFEQRPECELLYGAIVIDDTARHHGEEGAEMPSAWLERYEAETLPESNVADTSAIAHRAGLDARWDESLTTMGDWDLLLRLSVEREPLTLPAIACFYYTDAAERLSGLIDQSRRDRARIVERARAAREAERRDAEPRGR
jgi:hypothetical protein